MRLARLATALGCLLLLALSGCSNSPSDNSSSTGDTFPTSSEGSSNSPVDLGSPPATHNGFVDSDNPSYYVFSASDYTKVTLSGLSADADMEVFSGQSFVNSLCDTYSFGTEPEECVVYCYNGTCSYGIVVEPYFFDSTPFVLTLQDIGLGSTQYSDSFSFSDFFGDANIVVDVKEEGFTFSINVTSGDVFVCEISQQVIQSGFAIGLDSNQFTNPLEFDTENYVPFNYDGCGQIYPATNAYGDVFMVERMGFEPSQTFQFVFDTGVTYTLTPP